jgi:hypothetical protein
MRFRLWINTLLMTTTSHYHDGKNIGRVLIVFNKKGWCNKNNLYCIRHEELLTRGK